MFSIGNAKTFPHSFANVNRRVKIFFIYGVGKKKKEDVKLIEKYNSTHILHTHIHTAFFSYILNFFPTFCILARLLSLYFCFLPCSYNFRWRQLTPWWHNFEPITLPAEALASNFWHWIYSEQKIFIIDLKWQRCIWVYTDRILNFLFASLNRPFSVCVIFSFYYTSLYISIFNV